ncbi:hypothetical protein N7454_001653 [Penicillium verhagenii]|nr:hypothetical protein N7454_001653 [Penicillium verhagenii]
MASEAPKLAGFKILPATDDDFFALAQVEAIANDTATQTPIEANVSRLMFGLPNDENSKFRAKGMIERRRDDTSMKDYKVVVEEDGKEKIVAWASWNFYTDERVIKDWTNITWPETANGDACNGIIGRMTTLRQKHMSGKNYAFLQVLATLEEYRGRGIGSALLRQGIADAQELGLHDFWLTASADGRPLYAKFGFQDVEPLTVDLEQYGGSGDPNVMGMRRFPN